MRATRAIIDLPALRHNFQTVQAMAPESEIMAVIKADAYGHGLVPVARALGNAQLFAVACIEEAIELRDAGIKQRILLLEGFFNSDELPTIVKYDLEIVVHQQQQLEALEQFAQSSDEVKIALWLKLDSGMNRLGFPMPQAGDAYAALQNLSLTVKPIHLMTHFASADIDDGSAELQLQNFTNGLPATDLPMSLCNSAAIVSQKAAAADWVRPGLMLYGCAAGAGQTGTELGLSPVMNLESELFAIKAVQAGDYVGYGRRWQAQQDTRIGYIAIGYGDGYPRHAKSGTPVWLNGREVPLAGTVSMDMLAVDLGPESDDKIGDRAVLWGKELPTEVIAQHSDTIAYTLLCGVTRRVGFDYVV